MAHGSSGRREPGRTCGHSHAGRPNVSFSSRLLTDVERRYSQCEKEALAAVWGCERYWLYLFGQEFLLVTDNRAVQLIYGNSAARPPARIERWALRLTQFDFQVVHRPGKSNIADYFSRHPDPKVCTKALEKQQEVERYINTIVHNAVPNAITRHEVAEATLVDEELQQLKRWLESGPATQLPKSLSSYKHVAHECCCSQDGILLRGRNIIVPRALRARVLELAHQGHQGIVKTKALIRSKVWYPGIDEQVEDKIESCSFCQASAPAQQYPPLTPTPMPLGPWQVVAGDFFGPMADGKYWMVNLCLYSRWFSVHEIPSVAGEHVIPRMRELFAMLGAPKQYMSDNGAPFDSQAFREFAAESGFDHRRVTPAWPRANGAVESTMKKMGKVIRWAKMSGIPRSQALLTFLRTYRDTPHSTTKVAPSELMFGRSRTCGLPQEDTSESHRAELHRAARANCERANCERANERMSREYDARMRTREPDLEIGDLVLYKQERKSKTDTPWDPSPFIVTAVKGTMITAVRDGVERTRNVSCFKRWHDPTRFEEQEAEQRTETHREGDVDTPTPPEQARDNAQRQTSNQAALTANREAERTEAAVQPTQASRVQFEETSEADDQAYWPSTPSATTNETTKRRGRPVGKTAAVYAAERAEQAEVWAQERRLNPPPRQSARLLEQRRATAQEGGGDVVSQTS